eukprot:CAMPEP_0171683894 /NCGR_PEP_ID=MMETSP0991-20121206/1368_1 /TAXON_ID=483369 /ORGANISM="non described non described, Strain CCMP2098" /LENGTH=156 /DNA_ID=CAMNT_0012271325 /DNA_START=106 /DNA_END=574 /DNA_ORIENTATION=+
MAKAGASSLGVASPLFLAATGTTLETTPTTWPSQSWASSTQCAARPPPVPPPLHAQRLQAARDGKAWEHGNSSKRGTGKSRLVSDQDVGDGQYPLLGSTLLVKTNKQPQAAKYSTASAAAAASSATAAKTNTVLALGRVDHDANLASSSHGKRQQQ